MSTSFFVLLILKKISFPHHFKLLPLMDHISPYPSLPFPKSSLGFESGTFPLGLYRASRNGEVSSLSSTAIIKGHSLGVEKGGREI